MAENGEGCKKKSTQNMRKGKIMDMCKVKSDMEKAISARSFDEVSTILNNHPDVFLWRDEELDGSSFGVGAVGRAVFTFGISQNHHEERIMVNIIRALLQAGCCPLHFNSPYRYVCPGDFSNLHAVTTMDKLESSFEVVDLLMNHGACIHQTSHGKLTPLHHLMECMKNHAWHDSFRWKSKCDPLDCKFGWRMVETLLMHGANHEDINICDLDPADAMKWIHAKRNAKISKVMKR